MGQIDMVVGRDEGVGIVVIGGVAGVVADRMDEITSQTQRLLREIGGMLA